MKFFAGVVGVQKRKKLENDDVARGTLLPHSMNSRATSSRQPRLQRKDDGIFKCWSDDERSEWN